MNQFDSMVDTTWFGLVAGYLVSARSPIHTVLHVRDRDMLAQVAERLDRTLGADAALPPKWPEAFHAMLRDGNLKVSTRFPNASIAPTALIDAHQVRREARCDVIYLPPFYVVHTPGLFEGKVHRNSPKEREHDSRGQTQAATRQPKTKEHDHGHSH